MGGDPILCIPTPKGGRKAAGKCRTADDRKKMGGRKAAGQRRTAGLPQIMGGRKAAGQSRTADDRKK